MDSEQTRQLLSRRRLLQAAGATGVGLVVGGAGLHAVAPPVEAASLSFGIGPFDRALTTLSDQGYRVRAAGLADLGTGDILIDGTERSRRVLYQYADRVGPFMDHLGELSSTRVGGGDPSYGGLPRVRIEQHVHTTPIAIARYRGLSRPFRVDERFGFGLFPAGPLPGGWGHPRFWPAPGDFWGLVYALDPRNTPFLWMLASTAAYRAQVAPGTWGGPAPATRTVRTEVVVVQNAGQSEWLGYQAEETLLCACLQREQQEFFRFPSYLG